MFMVYIRSRIVDKFFLRSAALAIKEHSDFALLGADHNRLILNLLYQNHPALLRKKESMASIVADRQEKMLMLYCIYLFLKDALFTLFNLIRCYYFKYLLNIYASLLPNSEPLRSGNASLRGCNMGSRIYLSKEPIIMKIL
jgi:hypothetical protein